MKPIIAASHGDDIVAWRAGKPVRAASFLAEVRQVADGLPTGRHVLKEPVRQPLLDRLDILGCEPGRERTDPTRNIEPDPAG